MINLTPDVAEDLLEKVDARYQRRLSKRTVEKYSRDILSGNWTDTGDVIRLSKEGFLVDGQHRCAAVVKSGKPLPHPVILVDGVSVDDCAHIDRGRVRTMRDLGRLNGFKNPAIVSLARFKLKINSITASDCEMCDLAAQNEDAYSFAMRATTGEKHVKFATTVPVKLALAEMFMRDKVKAIEFAERFCSGFFNHKHDPALLLRNFCLGRYKISRAQLYRKAVGAMQLDLDERKVSKIFTADWRDER
jgi:hypothetical protein